MPIVHEGGRGGVTVRCYQEQEDLQEHLDGVDDDDEDEEDTSDRNNHTNTMSSSCSSLTPISGTSADATRTLDKDDSDNSKKERTTYTARLIVRLETNLKKLGVDTDGAVVANADGKSNERDVAMLVEGMAILIHESMCVSSRNYHSVQHVFDISDDMTDPIPILAALFHDCIYYHVDGGFSKRQLQKLRGVVVPNVTGCKLVLSADDSDETDRRLLEIVTSIFGFTVGQQLTPCTGVNEFLSAVIAVRELHPLLSVQLLAQIATCIEATIPFRGPNKQTGKSAIEQLHQRLIDTNDKYNIGMSDDEMVQAIQRAVLLANNDVGNFSTTDQAYFLDNTWSLLPESNVALRSKFLYTVQEFQFAMYKMHMFFGYVIQPNSIFQQFRNVPTDAELAVLTRRAKRNVVVGRRYIAAKLLSMSVLSAFAELTGGDAPIT